MRLQSEILSQTITQINKTITKEQYCFITDVGYNFFDVGYGVCWFWLHFSLVQSLYLVLQGYKIKSVS